MVNIKLPVFLVTHIYQLYPRLACFSCGPNWLSSSAFWWLSEWLNIDICICRYYLIMLIKHVYHVDTYIHIYHVFPRVWLTPYLFVTFGDQYVFFLLLLYIQEF